MGAYNVLATCDDRLSVLSQDDKPKTGAAMAMQLTVALMVGYVWTVGVLCYNRAI